MIWILTIRTHFLNWVGFLEYVNEPGDLSLQQEQQVLTAFTIGNGIGFIYGTMHKK